MKIGDWKWVLRLHLPLITSCDELNHLIIKLVGNTHYQTGKWESIRFRVRRVNHGFVVHFYKKRLSICSTLIIWSRVCFDRLSSKLERPFFDRTFKVKIYIFFFFCTRQIKWFSFFCSFYICFLLYRKSMDPYVIFVTRVRIGRVTDKQEIDFVLTVLNISCFLQFNPFVRVP